MEEWLKANPVSLLQYNFHCCLSYSVASSSKYWKWMISVHFCLMKGIWHLTSLYQIVRNTDGGVIDTACIVCGRVYAMVRCPSVCPSVCLSCWSLQQCVAGLLPWAWQAGDISCCTVGTEQQWRHSSTAVSSKGEQCHISNCHRTEHRLIFHLGKHQFVLTIFTRVTFCRPLFAESCLNAVRLLHVSSIKSPPMHVLTVFFSILSCDGLSLCWLLVTGALLFLIIY